MSALPLSVQNNLLFPSSSSTTDLERPAAGRLPLLGSLLCFGSRAAQYLQEVGGASAHAAVDVGFAGFDVVVEVVAEGLDVRDDFFATRWGEVAGEEDLQNVSVRSLTWMQLQKGCWEYYQMLRSRHRFCLP